jgi:hypothetical protein
MLVREVPLDADARHGYLSREGTFYPCGYEEHRYFAYWVFRYLYPAISIPEKPDDYFDALGWAKLSKQRIFYMPITTDENWMELENLSPAQLSVIRDWFLTTGSDKIDFNLQRISWAEFLESQQPIDYSVPLLVPGKR